MPPKQPPGNKLGPYAKKKLAVTQHWGWAKKHFINGQLAAGSSRANAEGLWAKRRGELKLLNVNWPYSQNLRPYVPGSRGEYEEEDYVTPDVHSSDYDDDGDPLYEGGNLTEEEIQRLFNSEDEPSNEEDSINAEDLLSALAEIEDIHRAGPSGVHQISPSSSMTEPMDRAGPSRKRPDGPIGPDEYENPRDPPVLSPIGSSVPGPSSTSSGGGSIGGDEPAGVNDTAGRGPTGGGLAGAGNNTLWHGFGGNTKGLHPRRHAMREKYSRSFAIHTEFNHAVTDAAMLDLALRDTKGQTAASIAATGGYPAHFCAGEVDHGGVFIPYTFMEGSMKHCDWNKPPHFIGYKLHKIGFDIKNLRLSVMNNPRTENLHVAPAPPGDARLWMFVDVDNDYGIPQNYSTAYGEHSYYFTEEDIVKPELARYQLPFVGYRQFAFKPEEAYIISQQPGWVNGTGTTVVSSVPHLLYDMKRSPHYKEFILSEGQLGLTYHVQAPTVRLPHFSVQNPTNTFIMQDNTSVGNYWDMTENRTAKTPKVHQWTTVMKTDYDDKDTPADAANLAAVHYYAVNEQQFTKDIVTTDPITQAERNIIEHRGRQPVKPQPDATQQITEEVSAGIHRNLPRHNIDDEGRRVCKTLSKRPPLFMFGIYKELEDQEDGPKFWRYYAYGQITYTAELEWFIDIGKYKPHIPIGLGGLYTTWEGGDTRDTARFRRSQMLAYPAIFRTGHSMMIEATPKEAPNTKNVFTM